MKIAVPLFGDRVAPHFGIASKVLVAEVQGGKIVKKSYHDLSGSGAMQSARKLFEIGIGTIICGGIETFFKDWLIRKGVKVVDNQSGTAGGALQKSLELQEPFKKA